MNELWVAVDFVRENAAVTRGCFLLVRSTSLELSPVSAAAASVESDRAAGSREVEDCIALGTSTRSQL